MIPQVPSSSSLYLSRALTTWFRAECIFIILDKSIPEENSTNVHSTQKYGTRLLHRRPTRPALWLMRVTQRWPETWTSS
jgi:hypothetical protein